MFDDEINEDGELQQQENEENVVHERKRKMTEIGNEMKKTRCK